MVCNLCKDYANINFRLAAILDFCCMLDILHVEHMHHNISINASKFLVIGGCLRCNEGPYSI